MNKHLCCLGLRTKRSLFHQHITFSHGHIAYSLYNFYVATMAIKRSLYIKILYRGVSVDYFVQFGAQFSTLGGFVMGQILI